jgi:carbonic anhydrase/acetyltransferase-like protein (isoleucine patch superfamily)
MSKKKSDQRDAARVKKRPYVTPRLVIHGDLRKITLGKGSNLSDGTGIPKTRSSTGPPG